jgi:sugar/nucleoside kinase (ribokinase family)
MLFLKMIRVGLEMACLKKRDVIAIGNAIYDSIFECTDQELAEHLSPYNLKKGLMTLIDEDVAIKMQSLKPTKVGAGGAAANSVANISIMGGKAGFLGTVSNDQTGQDLTKV